MVSAGEALNPGVIEAFREAVGLDIHDGYGQTETGTSPATSRTSRSGLARWDARCRASSCGSRATPTQAPSFRSRVASCPTFFSRYLDEEPGPVADRLVDGEWWPTGDVVRRDPDGFLWYEGRDDDLIVSSGYRIGPFEVESALLTHPAVAEAAAVGEPDAERGAVVRAIVVLRDGRAGAETGGGAPGAREGGHRALQGAADRRFRGRAAEDRQRQDQARRAATRLNRSAI